MVDEETKFQPVMRIAYEVVGHTSIFEVDKNNAWLLPGGRGPTIREKQLLERVRAAVETLVAEVATTEAEIIEKAVAKATEKAGGQ